MRFENEDLEWITGVIYVEALNRIQIAGRSGTHRERYRERQQKKKNIKQNKRLASDYKI